MTIEEYLTTAQMRRRAEQQAEFDQTAAGAWCQPPLEAWGHPLQMGEQSGYSACAALPMMRSPHQSGQLLLLMEAATPQHMVPRPPVGLGWLGQQPAQLVQPPQPLHLLYLLPVPAPAPEGAASIL